MVVSARVTVEGEPSLSLPPAPTLAVMTVSPAAAEAEW